MSETDMLICVILPTITILGFVLAWFIPEKCLKWLQDE